MLKGVVKNTFGTKLHKGMLLFYASTTDPDAIRQENGLILIGVKPSLAKKNMPFEATGQWVDGIFYCDTFEISYIGSHAVVSYLTSQLKGTRIGEKTIEKIVTFFGKDLFLLSRSEIENQLIKNFEKLPIPKRNLILNALFPAKSTLDALEEMFSSIDVDYEILLELVTKYEDDAERMLSVDPYFACLQVDAPFFVADSLAKKLNFDVFDPKRIRGIINYYLEKSAARGNTYCNTYDLAQAVSEMSLQSAYKSKIPEIITSNAIIGNKHYVLSDDKIALRRLFVAEQTIANASRRILRSKVKVHVTESLIDSISSELGLSFGEDQRKSFYLLDGPNLSILTGGPGTGKTTTVKGIAKAFKKVYPDAVIAYCAPTGRAAKRLSESVGQNAVTIHKLLDYCPYENGEATHKTANDPIDADFIIADEWSMVSAELAAMLFDAIKSGTRVLLVGDEDQLPSIDAGNVLHDMMSSGIIPTFQLNENYRQGEGSIVDNSKRIKKGIIPVSADDFKIIRTQDEKEGVGLLKKICQEEYLINDPFFTQIIEPSKKGISGTISMNQYMHQLVHPDIDNIHHGVMVGDKVIFTRTDYSKGYSNGDIGVISHMDNKGFTFWNGVSESYFTRSALADVTLAFSYTIHKSQGSENPVVIIYLPERMAHMMTRSLLYTSITRAKNKVIVIYTGNALSRCVNNTNDVKRNTRLKEFLQD